VRYLCAPCQYRVTPLPWKSGRGCGRQWRDLVSASWFCMQLPPVHCHSQRHSTSSTQHTWAVRWVVSTTDVSACARGSCHGSWHPSCGTPLATAMAPAWAAAAEISLGNLARACVQSGDSNKSHAAQPVWCACTPADPAGLALPGRNPAAQGCALWCLLSGAWPMVLS
jgi:hypothetical protein